VTIGPVWVFTEHSRASWSFYGATCEEDRGFHNHIFHKLRAGRGEFQHRTGFEKSVKPSALTNFFWGLKLATSLMTFGLNGDCILWATKTWKVSSAMITKYLLINILTNSDSRPRITALIPSIMRFWIPIQITFHALCRIYTRSVSKFGYIPAFQESSNKKGDDGVVSLEEVIKINTPISYNGRILNPDERKRILEMLAVLIPRS
jgi:hypothetical protein